MILRAGTTMTDRRTSLTVALTSEVEKEGTL